MKTHSGTTYFPLEGEVTGWGHQGNTGARIPGLLLKHWLPDSLELLLPGFMSGKMEKEGDQRQGWEDPAIQCGQAGVRASLGNPCLVCLIVVTSHF